jgi:TM2 domain-containing membrane protein YozV/DNA-directed RNA polymerase subunit RPC12/RpoP
MQLTPTSTIYDLNERELLILRQELEHRKKSAATTWILWLLIIGFFGAHRFYLGRIGSGVGMLFTIGGLGIWWLIDAFLISEMLRENQQKIQAEVLQEISALRERQGIPSRQTLICQRCGSQNTFGIKFCGACGASLQGGGQNPPSGTQQTSACPRCGTTIMVGANPCPSCHTLLNWRIQPR